MRLAEQANQALKLLNEYYDKAITDKAREQIEAMSLHVNGFAQPGFENKPMTVVMGNFKPVTAFDYSLGFTVEKDSTPLEIGSELTNIGIALISGPDWTACTDCLRLFTCSPEGEGSHYWKSDQGNICNNCVKNNPRLYLESLNGKYVRNIIKIDLVKANYWTVGSYYTLYNYGIEGMIVAIKQHGITNFFFKNFTVTNESYQIWVDGDEIKDMDLTKYINSMTGHLIDTQANITKAEIEKRQQ